MSRRTPNTDRDAGRRRRSRTVQPTAVAWLTVAWIAMWGSVTPMLVAAGVLVAVLVCLTFPLPPVKLAVRVRPLALLVLVGRFVVDVVRASVHVTTVVLTRRNLRNAVIEVDLTSSSDFVLTGVAAMLALVPGSIVVEARRSTHTLYLHVLDTPDREAAERFRQNALAVEARILRALPPREASEQPTSGPGRPARGASGGDES